MDFEKCKNLKDEMNNCYFKIVEFISRGVRNGLYDKIVAYSKLKNFNFSLVDFLYTVCLDQEIKSSRLFSYLVRVSNVMRKDLIGIPFDELFDYCQKNLTKIETIIVSVDSIYDVLVNDKMKQLM